MDELIFYPTAAIRIILDETVTNMGKVIAEHSAIPHVVTFLIGNNDRSLRGDTYSLPPETIASRVMLEEYCKRYGPIGYLVSGDASHDGRRVAYILVETSLFTKFFEFPVHQTEDRMVMSKKWTQYDWVNYTSLSYILNVPPQIINQIISRS
jgi:hypothetical protein